MFVKFISLRHNFVDLIVPFWLFKVSLSFERISFLSYDLLNETLENTKLSAVSWSHSSFKDSKKPKTPKKSSYFWRSPDVSVLYEFFCNSPNSHNLKQIKIYHYKNSLLKKTQNYSYHWHFRSMTSPLYPVHVFLLFFPHIFSICLLQQLGRIHYQFHFLQKGLSELVNGWFKNSFVKSLNCFLPLFMIAKKCFHKSLVLLKSRHEQLQNVSLSPKETLYLNCHLYQDHRSKLQKIHLFALLQNQSSGWTLFELFPIEMWLMIVVYFVNMKEYFQHMFCIQMKI